MSREERAKQFMPFASLRGYGDYIKEKEKIICPKKELTDEEADDLSKTVLSLKKGDIIKIKYYDNDGYITIQGAISRINLIEREITVIKTKINFDLILNIDLIQ